MQLNTAFNSYESWTPKKHHLILSQDCRFLGINIQHFEKYHIRNGLSVRGPIYTITTVQSIWKMWNNAKVAKNLTSSHLGAWGW